MKNKATLSRIIYTLMFLLSSNSYFLIKTIPPIGVLSAGILLFIYIFAGSTDSVNSGQRNAVCCHGLALIRIFTWAVWYCAALQIVIAAITYSSDPASANVSVILSYSCLWLLVLVGVICILIGCRTLERSDRITLVLSCIIPFLILIRYERIVGAVGQSMDAEVTDANR